MIIIPIIVAWPIMTVVTMYVWNKARGLKMYDNSVADILCALILWPLLLVFSTMELLDKIKPFRKRGKDG